MNLDENGIVVSLTRPLNLVFLFTASVERLNCLLITGTQPLLYDREWRSKHASCSISPTGGKLRMCRPSNFQSADLSLSVSSINPQPDQP